MIENIRKYTGLMIVVLVLLFIGLVFLENSFNNAFSGKPRMIIDGENVSFNEYNRKALNPLQIARDIGFSPLSESSRKLAAKYVGNKISNSQLFGSRAELLNYLTLAIGTSPERFLANRLAVREAGLEYGISPGPEEVEKFIEEGIFADADGKFDPKAYSDFLTEKLGRLGLDSRAFNEYVRDLLTAQNLANLIGGSLAPEPEAVRTSYLIGSQTISGQEISLASSKLENDQNPTEEEIKAYWEENQAKYNSDEKRGVSYLMIEPDWDKVLKEVEDKKAEEEKKRKEAEAERKAKEEEERKKAEEAAKKANEAAEETKEEAPAETPTPAEEEKEEGAQGEQGEEGEPAPPVVEEIAEKAQNAVEAVEKATEEVAEKAAEEVTKTAEDLLKKEAAANPTSDKPTITPITPAKPTTEAVKPVVKEKTAKEKLNGVQKTNAVKALNEKANEIWQIALDAATKKEGPIAALKDKGHKINEAEPFAKANAPEDLDVYAADQGIGKLADVVFKLPANGALDEKLSNPYRTNDGYFIGFLGEVIPSEPLSYEEAKVRVTVDLKKKMAREALKKQAEEARENLAKALEEGKIFAEAAKELELTVKPLKELKKPVLPIQYRGRFPDPPAFTAGKGTEPGSISKVHYTPNEEEPETALIVLVEKREFQEDETFATGLDGEMSNSTDNYRRMAFQAWLQNEYTKRDIQVIAPQQ